MRARAFARACARRAQRARACDCVLARVCPALVCACALGRAFELSRMPASVQDSGAPADV
eukprot:787598-Alexandrium_andersonii.AAC.1